MHLPDNRIFYLDEIRALAIIFVILVHVAQFYPTNITNLESTIPLWYISVGRIGVPLFFMLSGALLLNRDYDLKDFYKKRLVRILLPAVFWKIILLFYYDFNSLFDFNFLMLWIYKFSFPWFVYAILGVYLVIPVFNSFIRQHGIDGTEYFLIIWIVFMFLLNLNFNRTDYVMNIFANFGQYIGYAVLGYYLTNKSFKVYAAPMIVFNLIIFAACLILNLYIVNDYIIVIPYKSLILIIECSALFLIFRYIDKLATYRPERTLSKVYESIKNSFLAKIIYIISISSYTIYLMHSIPLDLIVNNFPVQTVEMIPEVFLLVTIVSVVISAVLYYIPIINSLCGIK